MHAYLRESKSPNPPPLHPPVSKNRKISALTHFLFINDRRGGLCYKSSGFLRPPRQCCKFYHSFSFYFNQALGIKWPDEPIKSLGVYYSYDPKLLHDRNFIEKLDSIKKLINI